MPVSPSVPPPADLLERLVARIREADRPWRSLFDDGSLPELAPFKRWFTDAQKSMFYRLLSPRHRRTFLEIGAGSGVVSAGLAEDYERGLAIDGNGLCVDFMSARFSADSIDNVVVRNGHVTRFPVQDASVDLVVANQETLPADVNDELPHGRLWSGFLQEAQRCLRPGGKLAFAVDNSWVVRGPARRAGALSGSVAGIRRKVRAAGLLNPRFFVIKPHRHVPVHIYSFHAASLGQMFNKHDRRSPLRRAVAGLSKRLRVPYPLAYFERSFYVVADR